MGSSTSRQAKLKTAIAITPDSNGENIGKKILFNDSHVALISLMMPVYFSSEELTKDDLHIARASWNLVLGDPIIGEINQHFIDNNIKERFGYPSTVAWFFDIFYKRFFDMHPSAKPLFKGGIKTQGRFMVKMITLLLSNLDDKVKFEDALVKLADVHNKRGIKAIEYGVVGEILFYTLRMVTGPVYDKTTHRAWVLVFSSMLTTLVPIAVQYEMTTESKFQGHRDFSSYTEGSITFDFVGAYAAGTGGVSGTSRDASDLKKESLMSASIPTMKSPSIVEECPF